MIKKFKMDSIDKCIGLIQAINKDSMKVRYYPISQTDIVERINKRNMQKDIDILLYEVEGVVLGYMELLIDTKEKYLQILVFFTKGEFNTIFDHYIEYIKDLFKTYKLHYVVSDFNRESINYMEKIGASSDGVEVMIHVSKEEVIPRTTNNVKVMGKEHHLEFKKLHDSLYNGAFWTGELILEDENRFNKLVIVNDNELIGYVITSALKRNEEEIYFVYSTDIECKLDLISCALIVAFETADTVQLLLEESEKNEIPILELLGFKEKESIITFLIESI